MHRRRSARATAERHPAASGILIGGAARS